MVIKNKNEIFIVKCPQTHNDDIIIELF